jgi:hypothetical protein
LLRGFAVAAAAASSSASSTSSSSAASLAAAAKAALARSLYPEIVNDPFAELLARAAGVKELTAAEEREEQEEGWQLEGETSSTLPPPPPRSALSAAAAAFADATLLYATDLVNLEADPKGAEYRQVILLGPGLDTRPQRLGWPAGTVLFECASADAHAVAAAALASDGARQLALEAAAEEEEEEEEEEDEEEEAEEESVFSSFNGSGAPRGRLLRRVVCDVSTEEGRENLGQALFAAGFRAERLSAWCVSAGAFDSNSSSTSSESSNSSPSLDLEALGQLFGAVASCAAFCSFLVGDLPPMTRREAEGVIAGSGLMGSVVAFGSEADEAGSLLWEERGWRVETGEEEEGKAVRWLFVGQQRSRSDAELGILRAFGEAAEEAEGFEDNVS